jgi:nitric-oxide synthase, bacterial
MYLESEHQVEEENVITPSTRLLISEAKEFLTKYYSDLNLPKSEFEDRLLTVTIDIIETGTYHQTIEELTFGAKVAWRNSTRCIGRIFWDTLIVRDYRHLTTAEEIFTAIVDHIEVATNRGNINDFNIRATIAWEARDTNLESPTHQVCWVQAR